MRLWHVYVAIAVVALVATMSQALGYFDAGFVGGTVDFWDDALTRFNEVLAKVRAEVAGQ